MTDAELLARFVRSQDQSAFAEIVNRHANLVVGAARRLAPLDADDVAQATFFLLARRATRLAGRTSLAGWLYVTATHCARNARRSRKRHERKLAAQTARDVARSETTNNDLAALLDAAIARLPSATRDVVLLRHVESLSVAETAERLGVAATTVTKRSERGLSKLRDFFAARGHATLGTAGVAALLATPTSHVDAATLATAATTTKASPAVAAIATTSLVVPAAVAVATAATLLIAGGVAAVAVSGRAVTTARATPATAPVAATTRPDVRTREAATAAADAFLAALRARDAATLASMLVAESAAIDGESTTRRAPSDAAAMAERLIADVRDGAYGRFPQRLALAGNGGSYSVAATRFDANGNRLTGPVDPDVIVGATLAAKTPTEAEIGHLVVELAVVDGAWRVTAAPFVADGATTVGARDALAGASVTQPLPADVARAASAAWARAERAMRESLDVGSLDAAKLPAFRAGLVEFDRAIGDFVDALRGSPLAVREGDASRVRAMTTGLLPLIDGQPFEAVKARLAELEKDATLGESMARVSDAAQKVTEALDASDDASSPTPRNAAFGPSATLTLAWTRERVRVRGPLAVPTWLYETQAWKRWESSHDVRTFRTRDDAGNAYEVEVGGASRDAAGKSTPMIGAVRQYRPDGTLAAVGRYLFGGRPYEWGEFDETGKRYAYRVSGRAGNTKDPDAINEVKFFAADGSIRYW